jgi:DNA-binding MarR family transcriptional regulator
VKADDDTIVASLSPDELAGIGRACFALHARMTARLLTRVYDAAVRPAGLRFAQFGLLGAIAHGSATSQTALAERLALERTTLVRNLKFLEQKGWIEPLPGGGRGLTHRLTQAGRDILGRAIPLWERAQADIEARLGGIDPDATRDAMRALRKAAR